MNFKEKFAWYSELVDNRIKASFCLSGTSDEILHKAMRYSLTAGGKRIRPVLSLAVADMLGGDIEIVMPFACALEMIHTSSLIHDDLPEMDDDDYRRGQLSNHKVFGAGMAVLAGDSLMNLSYEFISEALTGARDHIPGMLKAFRIIAESTGYRGMMGGQAIDLASEGADVDFDVVKRMHKMKTGALIKAAVLSPAAIFDANREETAALNDYSEKLGLAFQIRDDILDVTGEKAEIGKKPGGDAESGKATYMSFLGLEKSRTELSKLTAESVIDLRCFGDKAGFLVSMSEYFDMTGGRSA